MYAKKHHTLANNQRQPLLSEGRLHCCIPHTTLLQVPVEPPAGVPKSLDDAALLGAERARSVQLAEFATSRLVIAAMDSPTVGTNATRPAIPQLLSGLADLSNTCNQSSELSSSTNMWEGATISFSTQSCGVLLPSLDSQDPAAAAVAAVTAAVASTATACGGTQDCVSRSVSGD